MHVSVTNEFSATDMKKEKKILRMNMVKYINASKVNNV